jgi:hypothetical protein
MERVDGKSTSLLKVGRGTSPFEHVEWPRASLERIREAMGLLVESFVFQV